MARGENKFDPQLFRSLEIFDWDQLYILVGAVKPFQDCRQLTPTTKRKQLCAPCVSQVFVSPLLTEIVLLRVSRRRMQHEGDILVARQRLRFAAA